MLFFGQRSLKRALASYAEHHHRERNHQGLGNALLEEQPMPGDGDLLRRERLGGLLSFYRRAA